MEKIKKGDLFQTSWGYDQTNYDFIIVESVSPTGKTCICKRTSYDTVDRTGFYNEQKPIRKAFGKSFRMKVEYGNKWNSEDKGIYIRGSYIFCGGEDSENKRLDTFSQVDENRTYAETDSRFGH